MALDEQSVGATDEWYTPPHVFQALGCRFDVDVASPGREVTPWIPADEFITERSLEKNWPGFSWMNAPFGARMALVQWLEKFCRHANGIALVPDRTSCPWWQRFVPLADLVLFVAPKIRFIDKHCQEGKSPAQGTCLLTIGTRGVEALRRAQGRLGVLMTPIK